MLGTPVELPSRLPVEESNVPTMPDTDRLRLLVVTMLYEPDCVGIAAVTADMCTALAERGHDVTVYTTHPYYPEWIRKSDANPWRIQHEMIGRVKVRRYGMFIPSKPSRLLPRLIHELSFPLSLMRSLFRRERFDVVMVYCPLLGSVAFASFRKILCREPLWVNIQDIPAEAAMASGINRSKTFHGIASWVQRFLFNRGDVWSSISEDMVRQLDTIKPADTPIHLCPNWLIKPLFDQVRQLPSKVGRMPNKRLELLYCGTIGKKQGLLDFCKRLKTFDLDFHFQIHGDGGEGPAVRDWVQASGDTRFDVGQLLPESEFVRAIHTADWFVIPQKTGSGSSYFPSKLIPAMFVGTPVLAISDETGPLAREVAEHGVGVVVPWPQLDQLPAQLDAVQQDLETFRMLQNRCVERGDAYHRDRAIDRLEERLQGLRRNSDANPAHSRAPSCASDAPSPV